MIRKTLALLAGMLVAVSAWAAGAQLRADHPDTYTVRRGDTLWDISTKFLSKPWLWPEIWQANPQVKNPHLIYPGDVLNLSFINGPHLGLAPRVHAEEDAVPAIPLADLEMFLKELRVMDSEAVRSAPYVVGFEENRMRGTVGGNVYVRQLDAVPGQRWAIVRPSHVLRGFGDDRVAHELDSNVAMTNAPWREDTRHDGRRGRGDDLGVEVSVIGTAEVLRAGDPATLLLVDATQEVRAGDRLMPVDETPYDPYYYPHAPAAVADDARVIGFTDAMAAVGPRQVVMLSIGAGDGVENGQTYTVMQPGERISDDVASNSWRRGVGKKVTLPDEYVGHVMVFRTFDKTSYALVMDSLRPVTINAKLSLPE